MLRKSARFKQELPAGEMNVVSLMDILTTLLFFLLVAASFTHISGIDATGFLTNYLAVDNPNRKPTFTLQVALINDRKASILIGSLDGLKITDQEALLAYLKGQYQGEPAHGFTRTVEAADFKALLTEVQRSLVQIKKSFPSEFAAIAAFSDGVTYQQMIDSMAAIRSLDEKEQGFEVVNAVGKREKTKVLFPTVIVSEWSEGA